MMTNVLHPDIQKFWEKQGYSQFHRAGIHNNFIFAKKGNEKMDRMIGYYIEGQNVCYYLTEDGNSYVEEKMLKLIKLIAFL